jgi:hypothetical protein
MNPRVQRPNYSETYQYSDLPEATPQDFPEVVPQTYTNSQFGSPPHCPPTGYDGYTSQNDSPLSSKEQQGVAPPAPGTATTIAVPNQFDATAPWWKSRRVWIIVAVVGIIVLGAILGTTLGLLLNRKDGATTYVINPGFSKF